VVSWLDVIAEKVKALLRTPDERLVWMLPDLQLIEHTVGDANHLSQFPPSRCKDDPVIHVPGIEQARLLHRLIQRLQVDRPHQRSDQSGWRCLSAPFKNLFADLVSL